MMLPPPLAPTGRMRRWPPHPRAVGRARPRLYSPVAEARRWAWAPSGRVVAPAAAAAGARTARGRFPVASAAPAAAASKST